MAKYDIFFIATRDLAAHAASLDDAAVRTALDSDEIEWAIEEFGHCSTDVLMVVPVGGVIQPEWWTE